MAIALIWATGIFFGLATAQYLTWNGKLIEGFDITPVTVHSVHFYDHDVALINRLSSIVGSAIGAGNSVLIVATPEHRRALGNPMGLKEIGPMDLSGRATSPEQVHAGRHSRS